MGDRKLEKGDILLGEDEKGRTMIFHIASTMSNEYIAYTEFRPSNGKKGFKMNPVEGQVHHYGGSFESDHKTTFLSNKKTGNILLQPNDVEEHMEAILAKLERGRN